MEFWITVTVLAVLLLTGGYLRALFKRIAAAQKLRKCCRRNGFSIRQTGPLLSPNRSDKVTWRLEKGSTVYLIKLFGSAHKLETFYLNTNGTYRVQRIIPLTAGRGGSVAHTKMSGEKLLPETDWYGGEEPDPVKSYIPVYLFCPAPMEIRVIHGEAKPESPLIGSGAVGDDYMEALKKRRLNTDRSFGGWASGGYSFLTGSGVIHSGELFGGIYVYGTHDFIRLLDSHLLDSGTII